MPAVTDNRLKGNYGAALVMSRLSSECLVRPVAAETDVGVDLYCETVAAGRPFLHFWLQVKAGNQCSRDPSGDSASCSFDLDHLDYWARQPVPVFAALVPSDWPVIREPDIYVIDITTQTLLNTPPTNQKTFMLRSDYRWPVADRDSVRTFLMQVVPDTTARLQVSKGIVADSPTPTSQYVQTRPRVPVARFKDKILHQLRTTAAFAILFSQENSQPTTEDAEFRRILAKIVGQFGDDPHWENFYSRAISSHLDGDYEDAVAMYEKARRSIQGDPNVCNEESWQRQVYVIERLLEQAQRGYPLRCEELDRDYSGS
jgi:hypothetical protein